MALWRWVWDRLRVTPDGLHRWDQVGGGPDYDSTESVTARSALNLSAWWSSVRLTAETIATLPCGVFQKTGNERQPNPGHWLYSILHDTPNAEQTPVEFWEGRVAPLCMVGNSFAEKKFLGDRTVALLPMPAGQTSVHRDSNTNELYYEFVDRGKTNKLPLAKVFHIKGFAPNDEDEGLSPVAYAARSLGGALAAERAAARLYGRGMRATGFFSPPVDMSKEQREQFQKNYIAPGEGAQGEGKTLIFPPGFDWKPMSISPKDAELLMSRAYNVEDVCRWMRVPPILIGHAAAGQTMWGSGVEQIILGWLVLGLRAYLRRIEAAVNTRLLSAADRAAGISFEFNVEGLLRADSAARAALMSTLAQNGLRTRNELRSIDNYASIPGGDDLTVQSNLTPLQNLGAVQQNANMVAGAMRNWLLEERRNAA